jgi:allophanate hydrolase subunit 2
MADRQTTGGYPKIATVIAADMAVMASWRRTTSSRSPSAR